MSLQQYFGRWEGQAHTIDASGSWRTWSDAQPVLAQVGSAAALSVVVMDRRQPVRANELLLALVRAGSADGGVDQQPATFVASLLMPGGDRIIRSLSSLGPDIDAIVAGQLWIQVRAYPWRHRPRAVAKNILMETRRAVLADYGAATARRACLVPVAPPELTEALDQGPTPVTDVQVADLALLGLLAWARARGVLAREDAWLLWELVLATDDEPDPPLAGLGRGVTSLRAGVRVATARGLTPRTVERRRDRAVARLRQVSEDFEIGDASPVYPEGVAVLTGIGPHHGEGRNG